jgi:hypothetical protein
MMQEKPTVRIEEVSKDFPAPKFPDAEDIPFVELSNPLWQSEVARPENYPPARPDYDEPGFFESEGWQWFSEEAAPKMVEAVWWVVKVIFEFAALAIWGVVALIGAVLSMLFSGGDSPRTVHRPHTPTKSANVNVQVNPTIHVHINQ